MKTARNGRLIAVDLDRDDAGHAPSLLARERATAIRDLIAENSFQPSGHQGGAFRLGLATRENRLILDITDDGGAPVARHILSFRPLARVMRDYFAVCEGFRAAVASADARRIEAVDMGRRGLHDEGAELLRDRLAGKVEIDFATARRLFTLICALSWRAEAESAKP